MNTKISFPLRSRGAPTPRLFSGIALILLGCPCFWYRDTKCSHSSRSLCPFPSERANSISFSHQEAVPSFLQRGGHSPVPLLLTYGLYIYAPYEWRYPQLVFCSKQQLIWLHPLVSQWIKILTGNMSSNHLARIPVNMGLYVLYQVSKHPEVSSKTGRNAYDQHSSTMTAGELRVGSIVHLPNLLEFR